MTGIQYRISTDKVRNPYSHNTVLERDGVFYSVNHYRAGLTYDRNSFGERIYKHERFEIRYEVTSNTAV